VANARTERELRETAAARSRLSTCGEWSGQVDLFFYAVRWVSQLLKIRSSKNSETPRMTSTLRLPRVNQKGKRNESMRLWLKVWKRVAAIWTPPPPHLPIPPAPLGASSSVQFPRSVRRLLPERIY